MIDWQYYPKSKQAPKLLLQVIELFEAAAPNISSGNKELKSNEVLAFLRDGLKALQFEVEIGPKTGDSVPVPVLFGRRGTIAKSFKADAFHRAVGVVLEVEAGRAVDNNQFLKDLFQACMMADTRYLVLMFVNMMTYFMRAIWSGSGTLRAGGADAAPEPIRHRVEQERT